jgi:predicted DNA-binding transcriptional regulator YafY
MEDTPSIPVVIAYEHRYRKVFATRVWRSRAGNWCVLAWDPDVNEGDGGWRTFRADRIQGKIHMLGR